jgi:tetratricopeptide (TPR) repeat protein
LLESGNSNSANGAYEEAIADYTQAIGLRPDYAEAYFQRAWTYHEMGQDDMAMGDWSKTIELRPDQWGTYYVRGRVYYQNGQGESAVRDLTKAIELKPDTADFYRDRAMAYRLLKEYDKAWADVREVRKVYGRMDPKFLEDLSRESGRSQ